MTASPSSAGPSHLDPALHASATRLPHTVDARRVKEGLIVLRGEWEKAALGASLLLATGIIWWNSHAPSPPPPSA